MGDLKIVPIKLVAILKFPTCNNPIKNLTFVGVAQYIRKFIASFSIVWALLHARKIVDKFLELNMNQQNPLTNYNRGIVKPYPNTT